MVPMPLSGEMRGRRSEKERAQQIVQLVERQGESGVLLREL